VNYTKSISEVYMEMIFADFIYDNKAIRKNFEKAFGKSLEDLNKDKKRKFFAYTQAAQYYLFIGNQNMAYEHILKAEEFLRRSQNISEKLQFYYTYSWVLLELRKIAEGQKKLAEYKDFIDSNNIKGIAELFYINLKGKYLYFAGDRLSALKTSRESMDQSKAYYQSKNNNIFGEGLVTQALIAIDGNDTKKTRSLLDEANIVLSNVFGGESIDLTQAFIKTLFGEVALKEENKDKALSEFIRAENYYKKIKRSDLVESEEELRLYKNLAKVWYLRQDYDKSKIYFKKLVSYKGFNNEHVQSLLKEFGEQFLDQDRL